MFPFTCNNQVKFDDTTQMFISDMRVTYNFQAYYNTLIDSIHDYKCKNIMKAPLCESLEYSTSKNEASYNETPVSNQSWVTTSPRLHTDKLNWVQR